MAETKYLTMSEIHWSARPWREYRQGDTHLIVQNKRMVLLDTSIYFISTLGFAVLWHLVWLPCVYTWLNWGVHAPDVPLGALSVLTQAVVLALALDATLEQFPRARAILSVVFFGFTFLWSSHVIGDAAKCNFLPKLHFIPLESVYLAIQFIVYGSGIWMGHRF